MAKSRSPPRFSPIPRFSRIACIGGKYFCEINGPALKRKLFIPIKDKAPSSGIFLGEHLLPTFKHMAEKAISIGCGGIIPAELCAVAVYGISNITATDIDEKEVKKARKLAKMNKISNRIKIIRADLFEGVRKTKDYNLVFSDIAQMPLPPGEREMLHDHAGSDGWKYLQKIIEQSASYLKDNGFLSLFVFGFLGIKKRAGRKIQCLYERLEKSGFKPAKIFKYRRKIRQGGVTHSTLGYIKKIFPDSEFYDQKGNKTKDPLSCLDSGKNVYFDSYIIISKYIGRK